MKYVVDTVRRDGSVDLIEEKWKDASCIDRVRCCPINATHEWLGKTVTLQLVEVTKESEDEGGI